MCGIAGLVEGAGLTASAAEFAAALDALRHRGPDDGDVWREGPVTLGHRRLSIIDLSPAGRQPMISACERYVITFNGEIYNHAALRADLDQQAAHNWRGSSDTEVFLELISRRGIEAALTKANGMFAFGLWDRREQRLFLARDRFGEKPLYYTLSGGGFAFASELSALEQLKGLNLRVSPESMAQYFLRGYVPAPLSMYEGVSKLAPGSMLVWRPGDAPRVQTYWRIEDAVAEGADDRVSSMAEAVDRLDGLLQAAVAQRMEADVPVGVFLSGGVDSSLVAAAMQRAAGRPITTLTLGFDDPRLNEAEHARAVATHLGTRHVEEVASAYQARNIVTRLGRMYDEPLADASQIPTFMVCEMARRHVTVALTGDGGDEAFAGYRRHFATPQLWRRMRAIPMRSVAQAAIAATPSSAMDATLGFMKGFSDRYGVGGSVGKSVKRVGPWLGARSLLHLHELTLEKWPRGEPVVNGVGRIGADDVADPVAFESEVDQLCIHDMRNYLPGMILTKVDRASMAVSLETRIPLLDPAVVGFSLNLPPELRVGRATGKLVLRELLKRYVPEELTNRPKSGFAPPVRDWLTGPLREWAEDMLAPAQLARHGMLDVARVRAFWERYKSGDSIDDARAWAVLQLQGWMVARGL